MRGYGRLGRLVGVTVYVHWSLAVLVVALLAINADYLAGTAVLIALFFGIMVLHEVGHALAARRVGCAVYSIELYPLHGRTVCEAPRSPFDTAVLAWGGALAQFAVALPLLGYLAAFGYSSFGPWNAILAMFGPVSCAVACFNLLPIPRLDGATAWSIAPYLWSRGRVAWRTARARRPPPKKQLKLVPTEKEREWRH